MVFVTCTFARGIVTLQDTKHRIKVIVNKLIEPEYSNSSEHLYEAYHLQDTFLSILHVLSH